MLLCAYCASLRAVSARGSDAAPGLPGGRERERERERGAVSAGGSDAGQIRRASRTLVKSDAGQIRSWSNQTCVTHILARKLGIERATVPPTPPNPYSIDTGCVAPDLRDISLSTSISTSIPTSISISISISMFLSR